jgi:hypothetical protein
VLDRQGREVGIGDEVASQLVALDELSSTSACFAAGVGTRATSQAGSLPGRGDGVRPREACGRALALVVADEGGSGARVTAETTWIASSVLRAGSAIAPAAI